VSSPPHHYLAHYRWIRNVFKADAVMHVGKHGSLEWLPGKALGLSEECYPDLSIMDLPNLYPSIINDPGEGTQANGVVSGLEVLPLEELRRPRIDVVPRISGFFRDAFPNLVQLIDQAVQLLAVLEEKVESNLIRRHVLADPAQYRKGGAGEDEAWRLATLRVFGCTPGTYGAGVAELVESRQWKTRQDLGEAYILYSAHAYGQGVYGTQNQALFRQLLSRMDVNVKNEDSRGRRGSRRAGPAATRASPPHAARSWMTWEACGGRPGRRHEHRGRLLRSSGRADQ
jgi:cobalamin biosynthesis Mg chelatase CobN